MDFQITHYLVCIDSTEFQIRNFNTIFPPACLRQMAEKTPTTVDELVTGIDNMPRAKVTKYRAERFLDITRNYKYMIDSKYEIILSLCIMTESCKYTLRTNETVS